MWKSIHLPTLSAGLSIFLMLFIAYKVYQYKNEKAVAYTGAWDQVLPGY